MARSHPRIALRGHVLIWVRLVTALLSVTLLAGCGSPGGSSPTARASATPSANPIATAILAAYRAESEAFVAAVKIPDPAYPGLVATTVDPLLMQLRETLVYDKDNGIVGRGMAQLLHPHVISVTGNVAIVRDCVYSTLVSVYATTGQPVPNQPGGTQPEYDGVKATLNSMNGTWKVSDQAIVPGSCPPGY
jgi:hypothetical protein